LLSALPEKFLWTIASESEITGWDTDGVSQIGSGSSIAYDKVLAVYRLDGGKKRVCAEAPDKNIHIFDEASSLLKATKMFPKFYKLSGKIYIKPDPDYNAHVGSGNAFQHTYTDIEGTSVPVDSEEGDKGVIVYSAPPIVDENTDSWILAEYENIVLFYAASLDHFRLASVYRDLCKAQVDAVASGVLTFSISSTLPLTMNLTTNLPTFSFTSPLPTDINISSSLPSGLQLATSLPSVPVISTNLPSDFSTGIDDIDTVQELAHSFDVPSINDALIKAQQLIDGSVTTNNAQEWLDDEDSEMTAATIGVANAEIARAQSTLQKEQGRLEEFSSKVNQKLSKYQNDVGNYSAKVQKEATRMSSQLGKLQREVEKKVQIFSSEISKYQAEMAKESARTNIDITNYSSELGKEKTRVEFALAKWQADLGKSVQVYTLALQSYQAEVQKEVQRISGDVTKYQAEISKSSKDLEKQVQQFTLDIQAAGVYTTKSQQSIQTSGMFYQRAINELSAITGAITAPEQQQTSQRAEQGAST